MPQEEEVVAPAVVTKAPDNTESKKVVKELVDQLDVVKGSASSQASGMAQPERFDDSAEPVAVEQSTETARLEETTPAQPEKPLDRTVESKTAANEPKVEQPKVEPVQVASQNNTDDVLAADDQSASSGNVDELSSTTAQSTQLEPETTVEDEIASELQSIQQESQQTAGTVVSDVNAGAADTVEKVIETTTNSTDELADTPNANAANSVTESNYQYSEAALLALSGEDKALQLVVFSNENALNSFKQSYPQLQTYTYARTKNGQKQLVVVMAPFNDPTSAKAQISKLPAAFQNAFVKAISEIHSEISTN